MLGGPGPRPAGPWHCIRKNEPTEAEWLYLLRRMSYQSFDAAAANLGACLILPEAQPVAVAVFNVKVAAAVLLVAQSADDLHALSRELGV